MLDDITTGFSTGVGTGKYDWYAIAIDDAAENGYRRFNFAVPHGKDPLGESGREKWRVIHGPKESEYELRKEIFLLNLRFNMYVVVECVNDPADYYSDVLETRPVPITVRLDSENSVHDLLKSMLSWAEHLSDCTDVRSADPRELEDEIFMDYLRMKYAQAFKDASESHVDTGGV